MKIKYGNNRVVYINGSENTKGGYVTVNLFEIGANRSGRTLMMVLAGLIFIAVIAATGLFSADVEGEEGTTFTVTTDADSGIGSLRDILKNAKDGDVVTFDTSVTTITLISEILFNGKNITIDGGSGVVITKAAGSFRLLNSTATGSTLTLKGLTIENGDGGAYGDGGGVYAAGSISLVNCTFSNNMGRNGGGVYAKGSSDMTDCRFIRNEATAGGGAYVYASVVMTGCSFIENTVSGDTTSIGGGIYADADINMTGCEFIGNRSQGNGGGVLAYKDLIANDCVFVDNSASGDKKGGGGVSVRATAILTDCVFANNSAASGGGIYTQMSTCVMILINCTVFDNTSTSGNGAAIYSMNAAYLFHTTVSDNSGGVYAGVYSKTENVHLYNSIFAGNKYSHVVYVGESDIVIVGCLIEGEFVSGGTEPITYQDIFGENTFDLATGLHRVPDGGIAAGGATAITAADLSATTLTPAQQKTILSALEKDQAGASRLTAAGDRVTCGAVEAALFTEAEETVTTLISDINPSKPGETVTFTAKVEGLLSGTAAEGWVEFYNGTTLLGTAQLVSGEAAFFISVLSTGTHQICAEYLGDENFKPSGSELSHTVVQSGQPPTHDYCIKAFADLGTAISPAGMITVQSGGKMTFCFSADAGYSVLTVLVDGAPLSSADIANGCYTFYDVKMNHTIEVKSAEGSAIILTVVVAEGKGSVEFSVDGGALRKYISPVVLPDNSSLVLTASEDAGYKFIEWRSGGAVFSGSEITFDDITSSVYLEVYFEERDTTGSLIGDHLLWGIVGLLLLLTIGFLLWFIFWYRRYYDVYFLGEMVIAGEQKTRRKNEYRFSVEDGYTGAVYYHVGEEEQWKPLYPDEGGIYTILKREVIDNIYLETRN